MSSVIPIPVRYVQGEIVSPRASRRFDLALDRDKLHDLIIFHRLDKFNHRLVNTSVHPCLTKFLFHGNGRNPLTGNRRSRQLGFVCNFSNGISGVYQQRIIEQSMMNTPFEH
jgi:hypothetical protein